MLLRNLNGREMLVLRPSSVMFNVFNNASLHTKTAQPKLFCPPVSILTVAADFKSSSLEQKITIPVKAYLSHLNPHYLHQLLLRLRNEKQSTQLSSQFSLIPVALIFHGLSLFLQMNSSHPLSLKRKLTRLLINAMQLARKSAFSCQVLSL